MSSMQSAFRLVLTLGIAMGCLSCKQMQLVSATYQDPLPSDRSVIHERLGNEFTVLMKPTIGGSTIHMTLVVKAGAAAEAADEHGLAHFVEHMAFRGTSHFPGDSLIAFTNAKGLDFGSDINAFTSYNHVWYRLNIPSNDSEMLQKAIVIFRDWADGVTFDSTQVEAERKVILAELRHRGYLSRPHAEQLPYLNCSRFVGHPISGSDQDVKRITKAQLERFYRRWYQPYRMTLIVTGAVDEVSLMRKIRSNFAGLKNRNRLGYRPWRETPECRNVFIQNVHSDMQSDAVSLIYMHKLLSPKDSIDLKNELLCDFMGFLVSRYFGRLRLAEHTQLHDVRFSSSRLNPNSQKLSLTGTVMEGAHTKGYAVLRGVLKSIRQGGFPQEFLDEAIDAKRSELQELKTTPYADFSIQQMNESVFFGRTRMTAYQWSRFYLDMLDSLRKKDVDRTFNTLFPAEPHLVVAEGREPIDLDALRHLPIEPYAALPVDRDSDESQIAYFKRIKLLPGSVESRKPVTLLGKITYNRWRLANGVDAYYANIPDRSKTTVLYMAPGGISRLSKSERPIAPLLSLWSSFALIDGRPIVEIEPQLAAVGIAIHPFITATTHGFKVTFPPDHWQVGMALLHRALSGSMVDADRFILAKRKWIDRQRQRHETPKGTLLARVMAAVYPGDYRRQLPDLNRVAAVEALHFRALFDKLFGNANGFRLLFMGDLKEKDVIGALSTYAANLPVSGPSQKYGALSVMSNGTANAIVSLVEKEARNEITVYLWSKMISQSATDQAGLKILATIVEQRLVRVIREANGLVYSVRVSIRPAAIPATDQAIMVQFTCAPENRNRVLSLMQNEFNELARIGPTHDELAGVQQMLKHAFESVEKNPRWIRKMFERQFVHVVAEAENVDYKKTIERIDQAAIMALADRYLCHPDRLITAELRPGPEIERQ